jgi:hypothetical protein
MAGLRMQWLSRDQKQCWLTKNAGSTPIKKMTQGDGARVSLGLFLPCHCRSDLGPHGMI